jgi:hypothetical protein
MGGQREQISGRPETPLQPGARLADRHRRDHLGRSTGMAGFPDHGDDPKQSGGAPAKVRVA